MNLKQFIPPILTKIYLSAFAGKKRYNSYSEALEACGNSGYENKLLCEIVAEKTSIYISELKKNHLKLSPPTLFLAYAINYVAHECSNKPINVLDFGGACGLHYFEALHLLPSGIKLNWSVVETPEMVNVAKAKGLENSSLKFITKTDQFAEKADLVLSSSALMYVPDPITVFDNLLSLNSNLVVLNRMMFSSAEKNFITVQKSFLSANGPGPLPSGYIDQSIKYPHTTLSFNLIKTVAEKRNYILLSELDEQSGRFYISGENILGKGLIFKRRS